MIGPFVAFDFAHLHTQLTPIYVVSFFLHCNVYLPSCLVILATLSMLYQPLCPSFAFVAANKYSPFCVPCEYKL